MGICRERLQLPVRKVDEVELGEIDLGHIPLAIFLEMQSLDHDGPCRPGRSGAGTRPGVLTAAHGDHETATIRRPVVIADRPRNMYEGLRLAAAPVEQIELRLFLV